MGITKSSSLSFFPAAVLPFILDSQLKIADAGTTIIKRSRGDRWAEQSVQGRKTESSHDQNGFLSMF